MYFVCGTRRVFHLDETRWPRKTCENLAYGYRDTRKSPALESALRDRLAVVLAANRLSIAWRVWTDEFDHSLHVVLHIF